MLVSAGDWDRGEATPAPPRFLVSIRDLDLLVRCDCYGIVESQPASDFQSPYPIRLGEPDQIWLLRTRNFGSVPFRQRVEHQIFYVSLFDPSRELAVHVGQSISDMIARKD